MRKLRNVLIIFFIVILVGGLLKKSNVFSSFFDVFKSKPVVIDETPILIKEIKSIGQLVTYTSYDEVVADSIIMTRGSAFVNAFNHLSPVPLLPSADKELVLIANGKVLAGTDLSLLTDTSLSIRNDTVTLILPRAKIIEAIINPSDIEMYLEKGQWSSGEVMLVKLKARRKMEVRALQQNILGKADLKAKSILENFLTSLRYKNMVIIE